MVGVRTWIFRVLVLGAGGLLLYTFFQYWWTVEIFEVGRDVVVVYPYGLEAYIPLEYTSYIEGATMPAWFAPLMFIYLGLCIGGILYATFFKDRNIKLIGRVFNLNRLIIGLVGFSYIVVVTAAVIMISIRAAEYFDTPLTGFFNIVLGAAEYSGAESLLTFDYWLACAVGPLLLVLALLRNIIIGNTKTK
ncbi:hypothetical protein ACFLY3_04715 [Chloroflexota bacterium]